MKSKVCTKCGIDKLLAEFHKHPKGRGGRNTCCKQCFAARAKKRYDEHGGKEKARVKMREHRAKNRGKYNEYMQRWRDDNREHYNQYMKDYQRAVPVHVRKFGIEPDDYLRMLAEQEGKCAICKQEPDGNTVKNRRLAVDHDHKTGKVRALLCDKCNRGLGFFDEDTDTLWAAINYLTSASIDSTNAEKGSVF